MKREMILATLRERSLNTFEAIRIGDTCLHTTVSELRKAGYTITDSWEEVVTRFGRAVRVKRYSLAGEPLALIGRPK